MREAVIVATARTPIGKAARGAFNNTHGASLTGHVIQKAVERAKVEPGEVEDVIIGCANPEGATGHNIARDAALRAGLPVTVPGETINRFCSSGLMAISIASQRVMVDGIDVAVGGGVESISLVQYNMNKHRFADEWLVEHKPDIYMTMIETADIVAQRYQVTREQQDEFALLSQQRTAAGQKAGRFDAEIAPMKTVKLMADKDSGKTWTEEVTLAKDEGNRPDTTAQGLASLKPVRRGRLRHRRQCQPAFRRRLGLRGRGRRSSPRSAGSSRSASIAAWRWRDASPTRWASVRSSRCRSC